MTKLKIRFIKRFEEGKYLIKGIYEDKRYNCWFFETEFDPDLKEYNHFVTEDVIGKNVAWKERTIHRAVSELLNNHIDHILTLLYDQDRFEHEKGVIFKRD